MITPYIVLIICVVNLAKKYKRRLRFLTQRKSSIISLLPALPNGYKFSPIHLRVSFSSHYTPCNSCEQKTIPLVRIWLCNYFRFLLNVAALSNILSITLSRTFPSVFSRRPEVMVSRSLRSMGSLLKTNRPVEGAPVARVCQIECSFEEIRTKLN